MKKGTVPANNWDHHFLTRQSFAFIIPIMVNKNKDTNQDEFEITNEVPEIEDKEIEEVEELEADTVKKLKQKLRTYEEEKKTLLDEIQRTKADFLNARKRLEEERKREYSRSVISFIEDLLPACDSFYLAMSDKEAWAKADDNWRKGVEGIYAQLQNLLSKYQVKVVDPTGAKFDHHNHEALSYVTTEDPEQHEKVVQVVQLGYQITQSDGTTVLIRPARVAIGNFEQKN